MQRLRANKAERRSHIQPKINFDVKSADVHEKDGQVVFRFEQWDLNRPDSLTEMSCVCICSCSYLLTNARHLICKSSCACNSKDRWIWSQKRDVPCKSPWLDIQLLMVVWMDGYLGSVSQTKIWDFCGKKKNIFNHQVFLFCHATVKQQQIQQQLEAVSCHSINCNKWMSSRRQTKLWFFCIFKFTLHFSLVSFLWNSKHQGCNVILCFWSGFSL